MFTGHVFVCQEGIDNNLCEVFARDGDEVAVDNAELLCKLLNEHEKNVALATEDMK